MPKCSMCGGQGVEADYVGLEMKPVAVECSFCGGSGEREDELRLNIAANQERHMRMSAKEVKAWVDELVEIENRKPPKPIFMNPR